MNDSVEWKEVWAVRAREETPDFDLDRGFSLREEGIERLSERELIEFIDPRQLEVVLDAGCGTGVNISRLFTRVKKIIGIDYAAGSIERCQKRVEAQNIKNAELHVGSILEISLPDHKINKVICLSVLQYLNDHEVCQAFGEFARVLAPNGVVILHVKNRASIYWWTLLAAKRAKALLGGNGSTYNVRPFDWYIDALCVAGFQIEEFNGFNLLTIDHMPKWLSSSLQRFELKHYRSWLLRNAFIRRHMSDLKIRARLGVRSAEKHYRSSGNEFVDERLRSRTD